MSDTATLFLPAFVSENKSQSGERVVCPIRPNGVLGTQRYTPPQNGLARCPTTDPATPTGGLIVNRDGWDDIGLAHEADVVNSLRSNENGSPRGQS